MSLQVVKPLLFAAHNDDDDDDGDDYNFFVFLFLFLPLHLRSYRASCPDFKRNWKPRNLSKLNSF